MDPTEQAIRSFFSSIGRFLRQVWYGVRMLNRWSRLLALAVLLEAAALAYIQKDFFISLHDFKILGYLLRFLCLLLPLFYLAVLGALRQKELDKYKEKFAEVGFIGKDKKYPRLISEQADGKKEYLVFHSAIDIDAWRKQKAALETALDKKILLIEQAGSKRRVKLTAIDTTVTLPTILKWNDTYIDDDESVVVVGENELGPVKFDLNSDPHVLSAGVTGSGKSVLLRLIAWQLIKKGAAPFFIDFKGGVEFGRKYERFGPVLTNRETVVELLDLLVEETNGRLALFRSCEAKNIKDYYTRTGKRLSRIILVTDELAEMMDKSGAGKADKEVMAAIEGALSTIARLGRAPGVHLLMGVQRPDHKVVTGQIKNNVPVRICGRFADKAPSEIVLGNTAAQYLPNVKGRFMFQNGDATIEMQAYYFDDDMLGEVDQPERCLLVDGLARYARQEEPEPSMPKVNLKKQEQTPEAVPWEPAPEEDDEQEEYDFDFDI